MSQDQPPELTQRLIDALADGPLHEADLRRLDADQEAVTDALRSLVSRGLVHRDHLMTQPPQTTYRLGLARYHR